MKLSNQALGTIMMALQKSLLEQTDIVPILTALEFRLANEELICENPPNFKIPATNPVVELTETSESSGTTGSD